MHYTLCYNVCICKLILVLKFNKCKFMLKQNLSATKDKILLFDYTIETSFIKNFYFWLELGKIPLVRENNLGFSRLQLFYKKCSQTLCMWMNCASCFAFWFFRRECQRQDRNFFEFAEISIRKISIRKNNTHLFSEMFLQWRG